MRKPGQWGIMSLAVLLALGFCSLAMAQRGGGRGGPGGGGPGGGFGGGPPGGGFGGGGALGVLQDEKMRAEIGILPEQYAKLQAIGDRLRSQMGDMFSGMRGLSDEERTAKFAELREKMTSLTADMQKEMNEILLPDQVARLEQITVQSQMRRGNTADVLTSDPLAAKIGIVSDEDKERIRKAAEDAEAELRAKTEQLREEAKQKIIAAMTPAQQAKFRQLTGAPAEFSPPQFGGRGGPGGGPGGGGGGGFGGRGGPGGGGGGSGTQLQRPADGD